MKDKELRKQLVEVGLINSQFDELSVTNKYNTSPLAVFLHKLDKRELKVPTISLYTGRQVWSRSCCNMIDEIKEIPITQAVKMIIYHLGLELDSTPATEEKINGFKKKTRKVARKKK